MSLLIDKREKRYVNSCLSSSNAHQASMLSLRVFGEDITKPHTATLRGNDTIVPEEEAALNASATTSKPAPSEEDAVNA